MEPQGLCRPGSGHRAQGLRKRTVQGTKREASKVLAAMVAESHSCPVVSAGKGTLVGLCREWLDFTTPSFSPKTVETTRMHIEDPIIPWA